MNFHFQISFDSKYCDDDFFTVTNGVVEKVEEEQPNAIIDEQDEGVIIVNDRRIQRLLEERNDGKDFTAPAAMELVLLSSST